LEQLRLVETNCARLPVRVGCVIRSRCKRVRSEQRPNLRTPHARAGGGSPADPELTTFAVHYRDPSTAPTLTVVGGPSDAVLLARSSQESEPDWHSISEYAAVWQVCLTLRLMTAAESPVRDRRDRA